MWGRRDTRMTGIHCCILEVSSIVMEPWKPLRCNILCRAVGRLFAIQWKSHQSLPHTGVSPWLPSIHSKFRNLSLGHCLSEDVSSLSWVSLIFPLYSLLLPVLSPNNSPSTLLSEILVLREILDIGQNAFFPLQVPQSWRIRVSLCTFILFCTSRKGELTGVLRIPEAHRATIYA